MCGLIGKQPQGGCAGLHRNERPNCCLAMAARGDGIGYTECRLACWQRGTHFFWNAVQNGIAFFVSDLKRNFNEPRCNTAPSSEPGKQPVDSAPQNGRVIANC